MGVAERQQRLSSKERVVHHHHRVLEHTLEGLAGDLRALGQRLAAPGIHCE